MLHIVSNATQQSHEKAMTYWQSYLGRLRTISNFLNKRWERQAIQAEMRRHGESEAQQALLDKGVPTVTDWRWGCIFNLLEALLPLRGVLRLYCRTQDLQSNKTDDFDIHVLHECIHSDLFWAYSQMLLCMQAVLEDVSRWCEGCACHSEGGLGPGGRHAWNLRGQDDTYLSSGNGYMNLLGTHRSEVMYKTCPMRGRRSSELAVGDLLQLLRQRISVESVAIQTWLADALTGEERTLLVHDFVEGLGQIALILELKTAFWQQLPWKLCALGHVEEVKAQAAALEILEAFDTNPDDAGARHRVSQAFLGEHAGNVRKEFEAFSRGTSLVSCPALLEGVVALLGVPVVERFVERQHSVVKGALGLVRRHPTQVSGREGVVTSFILLCISTYRVRCSLTDVSVAHTYKPTT